MIHKIIVAVEGATIEHSDPDDSFPVGAGPVEELGRLRGVLGVAD